MIQVISVLGALAILAAYAANQLRWIGPSNLSYSVLNFLGAGVGRSSNGNGDFCFWKACGPWSASSRL